MELREFARRVNADTPVNGEWEFIDGQTVRYRTTPDVQVRDQYGVGSDPPPEAIAREMVSSGPVSPDVAVVEVSSEAGQFLGEFNVTKQLARGFVEYRLEPQPFTNRIGRAGNFTEGYNSGGTAPILTVSIDHVELRRAFLNKVRDWIRENATDHGAQLADWGLYNGSFQIPERNVRINPNSTVYTSVLLYNNESSSTLTEATKVWPKLYEDDYFSDDPDLTLQIRIYHAENGSFDYAWNIPSTLASSYASGNITQMGYRIELVRYAIDEVSGIPGVPNMIEQRN